MFETVSYALATAVPPLADAAQLARENINAGGGDAITLGSLWLSILLSGVVVFVASSIIWMATPLHKHDYKNPGEGSGPILEGMRRGNLPVGVYFLPWVDHKKEPAAMEAFHQGPWALLYVTGKPNIGKNLGAWFVHLLIVGVVVAFVMAHANIGPGAGYFDVFRVAGSAGLLAHGGYALPMAIWHGLPWKQVPARLVDAVVYALLTAGCFAGFWPEATG
ncbi:MAG: hypothetical protein SFZ23_10250 [Planctomycetota bacterium]|nr:hypothetical protein [Planctomycetota bacterium]